jgi:glycerophosphoryl diester phosphodiesterase
MNQGKQIAPTQKRFDVRIEAHRGAGRSRPDNSIQAFMRAVELQLEGVELDVWQSQDGIPIVLHGLSDATVELKDGSRKIINEIHSSELKALFLPGDETIPTLEEVLDVCKGKVCINIELKEAREDTMEKVLLLLKEKDMFKQIEMSSFQHINRDILYKYMEKLGLKENIAFGFLMAVDKYTIPSFSKELAGDTINLDYRMLLENKEACVSLITSAKENGMGVKFWFTRKVFENKQIFDELIALKVDTIITDEPVLLIEHLEEKRHQIQSV